MQCSQNKIILEYSEHHTVPIVNDLLLRHYENYKLQLDVYGIRQIKNETV